MAKVKVKALENLYEEDGLHGRGEVFEVEESRAKELGDGVKILKQQKAAKDKMIKGARNKMFRGAKNK